jgi:hypothetical protein
VTAIDAGVELPCVGELVSQAAVEEAVQETLLGDEVSVTV